MKFAVRIPRLRKRVPGLCAVVLLTSGLANKAANPEFYVKGEVEYHLGSERYTREFEFYVKGDAWQVTIERKLPDSVLPGPKTLPNGKVMEFPLPPGRKSGDKTAENRRQRTTMGGESVAEHYQFEQHKSYYLGDPAVAGTNQMARPPRPPGWQNVEKVTLFPGPVPVQTLEKVLPYLWLAFGSRPYFESLKTNMLVPFYNDWVGRFFVPSYRQETRWRLADTEPRLPVEVAYLNPGAKLERLFTNGVLTTNLVFVPYPPPYNNASTNGYFRVISQTNIGDMTLPVEFRFEEREPWGLVRRTVSGKVHTWYSYCPKKDLRLTFPPNSTVIDERIRTETNPAYSSGYRASRWLTTNEAVALKAVQSAPRQPIGPPKPRPWWERVLAVMALGVPLGVVWWRFYRRGAGASAPPAK